MKPAISVTSFKLDVNNGMTKSQLIEKYSISDASVKQIAKQLGLTVKRANTPKFELIFDDVTSTLNISGSVPVNCVNYEDITPQVEMLSSSLNN